MPPTAPVAGSAMCPSNPPPPSGMVQWTAPSATAWAWAGTMLPRSPDGATIYGVVDGVHAAARVENHLVAGRCVRGITLYKTVEAASARVDVVTTTGADPATGLNSILGLAGFAFVAFSTSFGLTWAFIRGEQR